jgi:DNA-binding transcriptional ArsR family regulator
MPQKQTVDIIDDANRARTALHPVRLRLLRLLDQPQSAVQLAGATGLPRQQVSYHLRKLEADGLVAGEEQRRVGRRIDRTYARTATSYVIAPRTLEGIAVDPATVADIFSSAFLTAVAARAVNDVAALQRAARAQGKRIPTLTLDAEVRFASPADQQRFADDLTRALAEIVARHHSPDSPQGRTFRVIAAGYPKPGPPSTASPEPRNLEPGA